MRTTLETKAKRVSAWNELLCTFRIVKEHNCKKSRKEQHHVSIADREEERDRLTELKGNVQEQQQQAIQN